MVAREGIGTGHGLGRQDVEARLQVLDLDAVRQGQCLGLLAVLAEHILVTRRGRAEDAVKVPLRKGHAGTH